MASNRGRFSVEELYSNSSQNCIRVSEKGNSLFLSNGVSCSVAGFESLDDCNEPEVKRSVLSSAFASPAGLASESELELTSGFDFAALRLVDLGTDESGYISRTGGSSGTMS